VNVFRLLTNPLVADDTMVVWGIKHYNDFLMTTLDLRSVPEGRINIHLAGRMGLSKNSVLQW
jgi:hypothetical protein